MSTQEVIKQLQFSNFYHAMFQIFQNELKIFSSLKLHTDLIVPIVLLSFILFFIAFVVRKLFVIRSNFKEEAVILEITPPAFTEKTAYTTQQLFSVIHNSRSGNRLVNWLLGRKTIFSFEIVSSKNEGIRYLIRTTQDQKENMKRKIVSYMPYIKVKEVDDYIEVKNNTNLFSKVFEFKLARSFAYPLEKQNMLNQHDPVAYITGMMTKLNPSELISFQLILSPIKIKEAHKISMMILRNEDVLYYLDSVQVSGFLKFLLGILNIIVIVISKLLQELQWAITELVNGGNKSSTLTNNYALFQKELKVTRAKPMRQLSSFEEEVVKSVQEKVDQPLFETTIRVYVSVNSKQELSERINGLKSSFEPFAVPQYQSLQARLNFPPYLIAKIREITFKKRLLSLINNKSASLLSVSEAADIYHFPYSTVTQTENIVKVHSKELPAPLSLKQNRKLSVIFGKNTYGGITTPIGLTKDERKTHMYIIGRTGSGKTTLMYSMAKHDIENGEGMAFIDPHGDVSEDLLACIPDNRKDDLIYLNPFDLKYPVGINLLELTPGLDDDEAELEKEVVAEGIVSLFRKVFSKEENANAHRIEYILRNTIHTAFTTENPTIFTIYDLLNNPPYQKQVVSHLQDKNLTNFWKFEFGRAGEYQVVKMVGGVTAKIGRFLFSPTAKRILEQKKSTINFNDILDGKILICNLSQGKLGEDTARLLGTTILTKLQQAALKRADIPQNKRRQFHLYVDEFQNFATLSFAKMLSEGRKYGLEVYMAEQSTSQQQDRTIVNIILSNVTTVICFRSGNPIDEQLLLSQFAPYVEQGEIQNLPRYRFYIKISAIESEEAFSGETLFMPVIKDTKKRERLIKTSRKNNAIVYQKTEASKKINVPVEKVDKVAHEALNTSGLPNTPEFQEAV